MQQGRVTLEADVNEAQEVAGEALRLETIDVVGRSGTPDNGYQISGITGNTSHDFAVGVGTMYVGGERVTLPAAVTYSTQTEWLDHVGDPLWPVSNVAASEFVYLLLREQEVSAVEDTALREQALGGPDTTQRKRLIQRIVRLPVNASKCATALQAAQASWTAAGLNFDSKTMMLKSPATLRVALVNQPAQATPCEPQAQGGYLGADNQLIRVQISKVTSKTSGKLVWGYNNASFLHRVKAPAAASPATLEFLTTPVDTYHAPHANQAVELLRCALQLSADNTDPLQNDYVAAHSGVVTTPSNGPASDPTSVTLPGSLPPAYVGGSNPMFLRLWEEEYSFTSGVPVELKGTGLKVTINLGGTAGDLTVGQYWMFAARPSTPAEIYPHRYLAAPQPPEGPRLWVCPLATIGWQQDKFLLLEDCREGFDDLVTLTKRKTGCCTVTVGDGVTSIGDYTKIGDAIAALPSAGGEVCVLAGSYEENVKLTGAKNIRIHGCHGRTKLTGKVPTDPVISVMDSQVISISALAITTETAVSISIGSTLPIDSQKVSKTIILQDLDITVRDKSAIECRHAEDIRIAHNSVQVKKLAASLSAKSDIGLWPAIFLQADHAEILKNVVRSEVSTPLTAALGGIQIGGGSRHVVVRLNEIENGNGNGVTLGSFVYVKAKDVKNNDYAGALDFATWQPVYSSGIFVDSAGCVHIGGGGGGKPKDPEGNPLVPISEGMLVDIRILDNDIFDMGGSGIADIVPPADMHGFEAVAFLEIDHNRIARCAALDRGDTGGAAKMLPGRGGVALLVSEHVTIRHNLIARNGQDFTRSICGIWTLFSSGLVIERNEIIDNGPYADTNQNLEPGPRGGIIIEAALHLLSEYFKAGIETGFPAARVHDNIVAATSGAALAILGMGAISVQNNELTSHGRDVPASSPYMIDQGRAVLGGCAVFVWNLAAGTELPDLIVDLFSAPQHAWSEPTDEKTTQLFATFSGDTTFNDNTVLMDGPNIDTMISAISVLSLGDIAFEDNQCSAQLGNAGIWFNALAAGWSLRLADNRFQETLARAAFSAGTLAMMNSTTCNQGTHCFVILGFSALSVATPNRSLVDLSPLISCKRFIVAIDEATAFRGWQTN